MLYSSGEIKKNRSQILIMVETMEFGVSFHNEHFELKMLGVNIAWMKNIF